MGGIVDWLLARTSRRRVLIAFAVMIAVQGLGGLARLAPALMRVTEALPDIHPGYDGPGLLALIGRLAAEPTATWIAYGLDMLNPTTGGAFYGLLLARLLVSTGRQGTAWRHALPVLLVALGLDVIENLVVLAFVAAYPSELIATLHLGLKALTLVKFGLMAVAFAALLALAAVWFRERATRR